MMCPNFIMRNSRKRHQRGSNPYLGAVVSIGNAIAGRAKALHKIQIRLGAFKARLKGGQDLPRAGGTVFKQSDENRKLPFGAVNASHHGVYDTIIGRVSAARCAGGKAKQGRHNAGQVAKIGASWRGMLGITQTELAKMLIESANACVTDMMRLQNHLQEKKGQSARLAASLIAFEEENVKRLRPYL